MEIPLAKLADDLIIAAQAALILGGEFAQSLRTSAAQW
jgi:hypothetical protein